MTALDTYKHASPLAAESPPEKGVGDDGWVETIALSNGVAVTLTADQHFSIASVRIFRGTRLIAPCIRRDYINIFQYPRTHTNDVYVLRTITLFQPSTGYRVTT